MPRGVSKHLRRLETSMAARAQQQQPSSTMLVQRMTSAARASSGLPLLTGTQHSTNNHKTTTKAHQVETSASRKHSPNQGNMDLSPDEASLDLDISPSSSPEDPNQQLLNRLFSSSSSALPSKFVPDKSSSLQATKSLLKHSHGTEVDNPRVLAAMLASTSSPSRDSRLEEASRVGSVVGIGHERSVSFEGSDVTMMTLEEKEKDGSGAPKKNVVPEKQQISNIETSPPVHDKKVARLCHPKSQGKSANISSSAHKITTLRASSMGENAMKFKSGHDGETNSLATAASRVSKHCNRAREKNRRRVQPSTPDSEEGSSSSKVRFQEETDPASGVRYIYLDDKFVMEHPPMPPAYTIHYSQTKDRLYYCHPDRGASWHCPVVLLDDKCHLSLRDDKSELGEDTQSMTTADMTSSDESSSVTSFSRQAGGAMANKDASDWKGEAYAQGLVDILKESHAVEAHESPAHGAHEDSEEEEEEEHGLVEDAAMENPQQQLSEQAGELISTIHQRRQQDSNVGAILLEGNPDCTDPLGNDKSLLEESANKCDGMPGEQEKESQSLAEPDNGAITQPVDQIEPSKAGQYDSSPKITLQDAPRMQVDTDSPIVDNTLDDFDEDNLANQHDMSPVAEDLPQDAPTMQVRADSPIVDNTLDASDEDEEETEDVNSPVLGENNRSGDAEQLQRQEGALVPGNTDDASEPSLHSLRSTQNTFKEAVGSLAMKNSGAVEQTAPTALEEKDFEAEVEGYAFYNDHDDIDLSPHHKRVSPNKRSSPYDSTSETESESSDQEEMSRHGGMSVATTRTDFTSRTEYTSLGESPHKRRRLSYRVVHPPQPVCSLINLNALFRAMRKAQRRKAGKRGKRTYAKNSEPTARALRFEEE